MFGGFFPDYFNLLIGNFGGFYFYFINGLLDGGRNRNRLRIVGLIVARIGGGGDLDVVRKEGVDVINYWPYGFA